MTAPVLSGALLEIDDAAVANQIATAIRRTVGRMRRRGGVVALSGGVDTAVVFIHT